MELSENGLTSWGQRYEWNLGGDITLYHDASCTNRRLVTHLNTCSDLPFENEYMDDSPAMLSTAERREWDALCLNFLIREQVIYKRIIDELRWYVGEQTKDMRKEVPEKRVIFPEDDDQMYHGAQDAVASALSISDEEIDIINYGEGANVIDLWLGDLLETEGYILD